MKKAIVKLAKSYFYNHELQIALGSTITFLVGGTTFYHVSEGWSWVDSLYFSVTTLATVGYGDLAPTKDASKLFTVFFIIFGVGIILTFVDYIAKHHLTMVNDRVAEGKVNRRSRKAASNIGRASRE